jgi:hypothetical protein
MEVFRNVHSCVFYVHGVVECEGRWKNAKCQEEDFAQALSAGQRENPAGAKGLAGEDGNGND